MDQLIAAYQGNFSARYAAAASNDTETLIARAKEFAAISRPMPELGIDAWDVEELCPFHGVREGQCNCTAAPQDPDGDPLDEFVA